MNVLSAPGIAAQLATRWLGQTIEVVPECASTNDEIKARAQRGAPHGLVVIAREQQGGRGRRGHTWHSPPGNLYASVLLRLPLPATALPPLTLAAGVAVSDWLNGQGLATSLKWPNDVLVPAPGSALAGKKIAGILTEMSTRAGEPSFLVVGVGVNANTVAFPAELADTATSLRLALGREVDLDAAAAGILGALERWVDRFVADGAGPIVQAFSAHTHMIGRRVRVDGREGTVLAIDDAGALTLDTTRGVERILAGEVVWP